MHALLYFLLEHVWNRAGAIALLAGLDLLAICHIPSVLLRRRGRPLAAVAWIFALISLPAIGLIIWWVVGRTHIRLESQDPGRSHRREDDGPSRADPEAMEALRDVIPPSWIEEE